MRALVALLPHGRTFAPDAWRRRHGVMVWLLALHAAGILVYALLRGQGFAHSLLEAGVPVLFATAAALAPFGRRVRANVAALGLVTCSALIVHLAGGSIEAHFHFFVIVTLLSVYEDWTVFGISILYVVAHHGLLGAVAPESVFAHVGPDESPWGWAAIHGVFVAAAGAAAMTAWQLNGDVRAQTSAALRRAQESDEALRESEQRHRGVVENLNEVVFQTDAGGNWTFLNRAWTEITGFAIEDSLGRPLAAYVHPDDRERSMGLLAPLVGRERDHARDELRCRTADGGVRWIEVWARPTVGGGGEVVGTSGTLTDLTDRRRAEQEWRSQYAVAEALAASDTFEAAFPAVLQALGQAMDWQAGSLWMAESGSGRLRCRAHWHAAGFEAPELDRLTASLALAPGEQLPGHVWRTGRPAPLEDIVERPRSPRVEAATRAGLEGALGLPILDGPDVVGVIEFFSSERPQLDRALLQTLAGRGAQIGQFLTRKRAEQRLSHQALHDDLTGLPNRTLFMDRLEQAIARAERAANLVAVIFLDVDNFKLVNDSLGHQQGDRLLCEVGDRLREQLRPTDTAARFGGDEFALVCGGVASEAEATGIVERVRERLREPLPLGDHEHTITVSVGLAVAAGGGDAAAAIRDADAAMYRAKDHGRDRYEVFDESMQNDALERLAVETSLRRAFDGGRLHLSYQPLVSLADEQVVGFEALLRCDDPQRGAIPPAEFVPVAEQSGMIVPIGEWVLEEACRQLGEWQARFPGRRLHMAVNLSARQLVEPTLSARVARAIEAAGIEAEQLRLEITETVLMEDSLRTRAHLAELRALGIGLVLDDFGTGYSSLGYLKRFRIDQVKVDRSFVAGLGDDPASEGIVKAILAMARAFDVTVVAEGVETAAQAARLRELGCEFAQGFHFGRPARAPDAIASVAAAPDVRAAA